MYKYNSIKLIKKTEDYALYSFIYNEYNNILNYIYVDDFKFSITNDLERLYDCIDNKRSFLFSTILYVEINYVSRIKELIFSLDEKEEKEYLLKKLKGKSHYVW